MTVVIRRGFVIYGAEMRATQTGSKQGGGPWS